MRVWWATIAGAFAVADVALWVPDCGDTVGMLGPQIQKVFTSLNTNVSDVNTIYASSTYNVPVTAALPTLFKLTAVSGRTHLIKATTGTLPASCYARSSRSVNTRSASAPAESTGPTPTTSILSTSRPTTTTPPPSTSEGGAGWVVKSCYKDGEVISESVQVIRAALDFCDSAYSCTPSISPNSGYVQTASYGPLIRMGIYNEACENGVAVLPQNSSTKGELVIHNRAVWACLQNMWHIWQTCKDGTAGENNGRGGLAQDGCRQYDINALRKSAAG